MNYQHTKKIRLGLEKICTYRQDSFTLTCNDYNSLTCKCVFGTEEGSIMNLSTSFDKPVAKYITDSSINSVSWITDTSVGCATDDHYVYVLDLIKDKMVFDTPSGGSIKYIKKTSDTTFYTCGRNKLAQGWDLRTRHSTTRLKHAGSVTCLETNKSYDKILYTVSTQGTNMNYWDLRYTRKGEYILESKVVCQDICNNLLYFKNNLFLKDLRSNIYKVSEKILFSDSILESDSISYYSSIGYSEYYDCLFSIDKDKVYTVCKYSAVQCDMISTLQNQRGLFCVNDTLSVYNKHNINQYQIVPFLDYRNNIKDWIT